MQGEDRNANVQLLVETYLRSDIALADYLQTVDPDLRDEVEARCTEAEFIDAFFGEIKPEKGHAPRPDVIEGCELLEKLGEGAMGQVYRGRQTKLDREVAIKLVRGELLHREDFLQRFEREAKTLAGLDHPGIVKVLSFGEQDGWHYFVMELVRGRSLDTALPELKNDHDRTARVVAELLEAIAYAHGRGITHRDLKPSNVMLDDSGRPRLVDFGLAKAIATDSDDQLRTVQGLLLGTPAFISPEAATHRKSRTTDGDLWAVGVMLYQVLTGRLPYVADSTDALFDMLREPRWLDPRTTASQVPAPLAMICRRALAPHPDDRYRNAQQFAADLRRFLARETVDAERTWSVERVQRHAYRHRHRYGVATATMLAAGLIWFGAQTAAAAEKTRSAVNDVMSGPAVETQSMDELRPRTTKARELLATSDLDDDSRLAVEGFVTSAERSAIRVFEDGVAEIHAGLGSKSPPSAPDQVRQMAGLQQAIRAAGVLPQKRAGASLLEQAYPVLQVENPVGMAAVNVRVQALDPLIGQATVVVHESTTPTTVALPTGYYRITVGNEHGFAECVRVLASVEPTVVLPTIVPTSAAPPGMVEIPAGTAIIGQQEVGALNAVYQTITHAGFFIDQYEVTCGQYNEYCLATEHPIPHKWGGAYKPEWQQLPAIGVSWDEANAYAEWAGKRLPTFAEWQIAARGTDGRVFPWGNTMAQLAEMPTIATGKEKWFEGVRPVGTTPLDTSPYGVFDMLGNIDEWTSTPYVAQLHGMPFPVLPWRLRGGSNWDARRDYSDLDSVSPGQPEWYGSGFRCAKSLPPQEN